MPSGLVDTVDGITHRMPLYKDFFFKKNTGNRNKLGKEMNSGY